MPILIAVAFFILALPFNFAAADGAEPLSAYGTYYGSGRACGGKMSITRDKISWDSAFNQCLSSNYDVLHQKIDGSNFSIALQIRTPSPKCGTPFIAIDRVTQQNGAIGWNVSGYSSLKSMRDNSIDSLSCYMVRS